MLDDHGQPPIAFNWQRNLRKSMQALLGLCQGLIADDRLSPEEIVFLDTWLKENDAVTREWPGTVIACRVARILADGIVTSEEADDLKETLAQITGDAFKEHGVASGMSMSFPVTPVHSILFEGRSFCFTGKFIYGPRARCQQATEALGGSCAGNVTQQLDFLVIGGLASRDWVNTSYGRKIQKAVQYRDRGSAIAIIDEENWAGFV